MTPATHEFISNLRGTAGYFVPTAEAAESVTPQSQMDAVQRSIRNSALWLVSGVYRDYETADFSDMPDKARQELDSCIQRLRGYIAQFPPDKGPPPEIFQAAAPVFLRLMNLIDTSYPKDRSA